MRPRRQNGEDDEQRVFPFIVFPQSRFRDKNAIVVKNNVHEYIRINRPSQRESGENSKKATNQNAVFSPNSRRILPPANTAHAIIAANEKQRAAKTDCPNTDCHDFSKTK